MGHFKRDLDWKMKNLKKLKLKPEKYKYFKDSLKLFQNIKRSIYIDRKRKILKETDIFVCECIKSIEATENQIKDPSISIDCGKNCINMQISTECEFNSCPSQELCQNRRFQQQQDSFVYPFFTGAKGWGLAAGEFISKGQFIMQYLGEVFSMNSEEGKKRCNKYSKMTCTYLMKIGKREVIDPTEKGSIARFINHSCNPNCETRKWNILGEVEVGIFALKDIKEDEELTFDYKFDVFKTAFTICLCRSINCRGYLGIVPTDYTPEEWEYKLNNLYCEICKKNIENDGDLLLLCDGCNNGFHTFCLNPPLKEMPGGSWFCDTCKTRNKNIKYEYPFKEDEDKISVNDKIEINKNIIKKKQKIESSLYNDKEDFEFLNNYLSDDSEEEYLLEKNDKSRNLNNIYSEAEILAFNYFNEKIKNSEVFEKLYNSAFLNELNKIEDNKRDSFQVSLIEITVFKEKIFRLIVLKIKAKIFWNQSQYQKYNIFLRNNEFTIIGNESQINYIKNIINLIQKYCNNLKDKYGISEAIMNIPTIFFKRFTIYYHNNISNFEVDYKVKIFYDKTYLKEDSCPIYNINKLYLRGRKNNIVIVHSIIKEKLKNFWVKRIYLNSDYINIILDNISEIKKCIEPAEIRFRYDKGNRYINNSHYTIYTMIKEVSVIGTKEELSKAIEFIFKYIYSKTEVRTTKFSLSYQLPKYNLKDLDYIKNELYKDFSDIKIIINDPISLKKKISINIIVNYKNYRKFYEKLCYMLNKYYFKFEGFKEYQKNINYDFSNYLFKNMQFYKHTKSVLFLKSWDILSQNYLNDFDYINYLFNEINNSFRLDIKELLFNIFFSLKSIILEKFKTFNLSKISILKILKHIIFKINIPNPSLFDQEIPQLLKKYYNKKDYSVSNTSSYYSKEKYIKRKKNSITSSSSISNKIKKNKRKRSYSIDSFEHKRSQNIEKKYYKERYYDDYKPRNYYKNNHQNYNYRSSCNRYSYSKRY